jgi:hypothetical protein
MRAAMMSCTEPGLACETHSGSPSGAMTAWMLPPRERAAGVRHVDDLALNAEGLLPAPVSRDDRAVQDHVRQALVTVRSSAWRRSGA